MSINDLVAQIWANTTRTLASGTPSEPVTRDELIAQAFWEYSERSLTSVTYEILIVPTPTIGGSAYGELPFGVLALADPTILAPSDLTVVATGSTSIMLTWIDNSDNEFGFEIQRLRVG